MSSSYYVSETLHTAQLAWASYGLYNSYIAIRNLQQYEDMTKKAAKWSTEAESQLHQTRTTQAAGALAIVASMATSAALTLSWHNLPYSVKVLANPAVMVLVFACRQHVANFWTGKAKVPLVDGYNEAISKTGELLEILRYLGYSWAVTTVVAGLFGFE